MLYTLKTVPYRSFKFGSSTYKLCTALNYPCTKHKKSSILENSLDLKRLSSYNQYIIKQQRCDFHTSQRLYVSPATVIVLQYVPTFIPIAGIVIRVWWRRRSEEQREAHKDWFRKRKHIFFSSLGLCSLILLYYYITHIEVHPLTQRSRFLIFNEKEELEWERYFRDKIIQILNRFPHNYAINEELESIVLSIVNANRDWIVNRPGLKWTATVINIFIPDATVLPGGCIVIFDGLLKLIENDNQLAIVISHEIAHILLQHHSELVSRYMVWNVLTVIPILCIWTVFNGFIALVLHIIMKKIINIFNILPLHRHLETEADEIGLQLAAKACVDIRAAPRYWELLEFLSKMRVMPNITVGHSWLSSHPSYAERKQNMQRIMSKTLELRDAAGCPVLPERNFTKLETREDHEIVVKRREN